jgi:hypothetical protein
VPHERHEVVLAHGVQRDVADHDHLVVVGLEGHPEVAARVLVEAGGDLGPHAGDAVGRVVQALAGDVLADRRQQLAHGGGDPGLVDPGPRLGGRPDGVGVGRGRHQAPL